MPRVSRRGEVRSAAARLFREHGYASATMDLIAEDVGLNKGTLYHYYPSKAAILYEIISDHLDATVDLLPKVPEEGTPAERFREFIHLQVNRVVNDVDELVVFFQEVPWIDKHLDAAPAAEVRERIETYRAFTEQLLTEGMAAGEFRTIDVGTIHHSIVGILAYIPNWFSSRKGRTKAALVEEVAEFIMNGVLKH